MNVGRRGGIIYGGELYLNKSEHSYGYPDMLVDENDNLFMVYNRSGLEEWPGIFYTAKPAGADSFLDDAPLIKPLASSG